MSEKIKVQIIMEGGLIQAILCQDRSVDIEVIDYDVEGVDLSQLSMVDVSDGDELEEEPAYVSQMGVDGDKYMEWRPKTNAEKIQDMTDAFATLDNCKNLGDVVEAMGGYTSYLTAEEIAGTWTYQGAKEAGFDMDRDTLYFHMEFLIEEVNETMNENNPIEWDVTLALDFAEYLANTIDTE